MDHRCVPSAEQPDAESTQYDAFVIDGHQFCVGDSVYVCKDGNAELTLIYRLDRIIVVGGCKLALFGS